jgi:hypothetical protein
MHPSDDDLVLYHYGEGDDRAELERHVAVCAECRGRLDALRRDLALLDALPVPERGEGYGARVWQRVRPRLSRRSPRRFWVPTALAASLLAAFLLGRHFPETPLPLSAPVRERILLVAVGDHLERSQLVLVELANADPSGPLTLGSERKLAQDLVGESRLYRQSAVRAGEAGVADVLDDVERILVEIAHSPETLSPADLRTLQRRIESRGILFKMRILGSRMREREKEASRT